MTGAARMALAYAYLSGLGGSTISANTVSGRYYGIFLDYSGGNTIFHNSFVDNTYQLLSISSTNTWNNSAKEGNYWSDYVGLDDGSGGRVAGDGIGDTNLPHLGVDWYPLMFPPAEPNSVAGGELCTESPC